METKAPVSGRPEGTVPRIDNLSNPGGAAWSSSRLTAWVVRKGWAAAWAAPDHAKPSVVNISGSIGRLCRGRALLRCGLCAAPVLDKEVEELALATARYRVHASVHLPADQVVEMPAGRRRGPSALQAAGRSEALHSAHDGGRRRIAPIRLRPGSQAADGAGLARRIAVLSSGLRLGRRVMVPLLGRVAFMAGAGAMMNLQVAGRG